MRVQGAKHRDHVVGALADRQYGVVSREQLLAAGIGRGAIARGAETGRLRAVFRGVYAVGHVALSREGWWMAALLTCGEGSALSHRTAATVWGLLAGPVLPINARSHLERLFFALTRKARLPKPAPNHEIAGRRRDFAWPDQRLVVETDGYRYHSSRHARRRDNRRDRQLTALGWRPVRFTYEEIALEPAEVAKELAGLLARGRLAL
jgi:very-short-patch-repair endonuclease